MPRSSRWTQAGERARGATLYINLEPCSHQGRTPPCVDALIAAGVARVVAAMQDPNPLVAGDGFRRLRDAGVEVEMAPEFTAEAEKLNEPFVHFMRTGRPLVTLKTAITLDGKISAPDDNRGWITSERARAHVQQLRHDRDAILTGIGTVLADDCLLTDRTGAAALPSAAAHRDGFAASPAARFQDGRTARAEDLLVVDHVGGAGGTPQGAGEPRRRRCWSSTAPAAAPTCAAWCDWLAERKISLADDRGGQQSELGGARKRTSWTGSSSTTARRFWAALEALPMAGGIGRRRRSDAIRVHDITIHPIPPDEFAVEGTMFTGIIEELGTVESIEPRPPAPPDGACKTVHAGHDAKARASPSTACA